MRVHLDEMTALIVDDCRFFGVPEGGIRSLKKDVLRRDPGDRGSCFEFGYSDELGFFLLNWERGVSNFGISSKDELAFRFLFQRHIVLHDFCGVGWEETATAEAEQFMAQAKPVFGKTQEYQDAELALKRKLEHLQKLDDCE